MNKPRLQSKEGLTPIYNPDNEDFTVTYDINGNNRPESFTIHSNEIEYFIPPIADHLKHHLAKRLVGKRGTSGSNWADEVEKAEKEIEVHLD